MKNCFLQLALALLLPACCPAQHSLLKIAETDTIFPVPESILLDSSHQQFYVSMVDGKSMDKDGKGSIYILEQDGQTVKTAGWVTGLDAPKGMALHKGRLYVADLQNLVTVDQESGKILERHHIDSAGMLNDVAVNPVNGDLYVSDSKGGKIYRFSQGEGTIFTNDLVNPNGLLWQDNHLYYLDSGILFKTRDGHQADRLATGMAKDTDGLQDAGKGNFLASAWSGAVYFIDAKGRVQQLLDSRNAKINTADFYYDKKTRLLYIPTFYHKNIMVYELK